GVNVPTSGRTLTRPRPSECSSAPAVAPAAPRSSAPPLAPAAPRSSAPPLAPAALHAVAFGGLFQARRTCGRLREHEHLHAAVDARQRLHRDAREHLPGVALDVHHLR